MSQRAFHPLQAVEIAHAFGLQKVDYLFIGKSGAILLGYPSTTQDVDLYPEKSPENGARIITALESIGFDLDERLKGDIISGRDFVQIKTGPFDVDLVFAPDGIESYSKARERRIVEGEFPVANLRDIIESKRASGRQKDINELPLLESFRVEYERIHPQPLKQAWEIQRD